MSDSTDPRDWATRAREWSERAKRAEEVARSTLVTRGRLERRLGRLEGALSLLLELDDRMDSEQRERLRKLLDQDGVWSGSKHDKDAA